jgi:hypothetical protein
MYQPLTRWIEYIGKRYTHLECLKLVALDNLQDDDNEDEDVLVNNDLEWAQLDEQHSIQLSFLRQFLESTMHRAIANFRELKFYSVDFFPIYEQLLRTFNGRYIALTSVEIYTSDDLDIKKQLDSLAALSKKQHLTSLGVIVHYDGCK